VTGGVGASSGVVLAMRALPAPQQLLLIAVGRLGGEALAARGLHVQAPAGAGAGGAASRFIGAGAAPAALLRPGEDAPPPRAAPAARATLGDAEALHARLCRAVGVAPYSAGEFVEAADVLASQGLLNVAAGGEPRQRRTSLRVADDDIIRALADVPVLRALVEAAP
jgi:hypothetical protein